MSTPFSEHDLLYGVFAVQMGFVDRKQLMRAIQDRSQAEFGSLGEVLQNHQALSEQSKKKLDAMVEEHLELHSHDAVKSLATLSGTDSLEDELRTLGFPDLNATLAQLQSTVNAPPSKTSRRNRELPEANRFRIMHLHAKGGIGQVSVAVDKELSREVALKELQARFADDQATRSRFVLEAEITGGLEHPGVVPVYGLGRYADGRPFYAMRFVRGDSLQDATQRFHDRFARKRADDGFDLELRKLLQRFIDVCNAMEYAHSRGVLHRDLKPGNIMLGNYGETLVVDWGLAKVGTEPSEHTAPVDESALYPASASDSAPTQLGSTVGTPHYMSPEQAAGRIDELDATSDVYSLGATLYHILVGNPPHQGSDIGVVLAAVQTGILRPPRSINHRITKPLESICLKAMAHQPTGRYQSARALAEDLERYLADESIESMPDSTLQRLQRWARRHRGVMLATAVGLLLVSAISALSYVVVSAERDEAQKQRDRAISSEQQAQASSQAAEKARTVAEAQERKASRVAYNSTLSEASALLDSDPMMARFLLENEVRCPPQERDFVWNCLVQQVVREELAIPLSNPKTHLVCYSPDSKAIAVGGGESGDVILRNARTGKKVAAFKTGLSSTQSLIFSLDGRQLAIADEVPLEGEPYSQSTRVDLQIWDVATREKRLSRQLTLPHNHMLCATEKGFFLHSFVSESDYLASQPEHSGNQPQQADENGQLINSWYQWRSYDIQSEEELVKILKVGVGVGIAEGFFVHGKWLTSPAHTAEGEYLWIYDVFQQAGKFIKVGPATKSKSSLLISSNESAAFFLGVTYVEESVSEIDSLAYLDTIEFDTDISFQELDFDGPTSQQSIPIGRLHSGVFIEDERSQFAATDNEGKFLATVMESRPVIQLVDLNGPKVIHWIPAHLGDVVSVAISPDGRQLASLGLDRMLRLWNIPSMSAQRDFVKPTVERPRRLLLPPAGGEIVLLALGPDSSEHEIDYSQPLPAGETDYPVHAFFQMEKLRLTDTKSLTSRDFQDPPRRKPAQGKNLLGVFGSFSEGIGEAVAGSFSVNPVQNELTEAKLSVDGSQLVLAGPERLLSYDLQTGKAEELWGEYYPDLKEPIQLRRIVVSDDLKLFATLQEEDRSIRVYEFASQKLLWQLSEQESRAFELMFVPGGHSLLVMRKAEATAHAASSTLCEIINTDSRTSRTITLPLIDTHHPPVLSDDGQLLVVFQQYDREILVFDLNSGENISQVNVVRETPGGILPGSELLMLFGEAGELKLWDTRLNQYRANLHVFENEVISAAELSRDGSTLVILGDRGGLRFLGANRLRDDLADIHNLMQVPLIQPHEETSSSPQPNPTTTNEILPEIEVLDDLPQNLLSRPRAAKSDESVPLPPAPAPIPPAPIPLEPSSSD